MDLDLSLLSVPNLAALQKILESELERQNEKKHKLYLLFLVTQVRIYIKERTG